jgi:hypothetical protein
MENIIRVLIIALIALGAYYVIKNEAAPAKGGMRGGYFLPLPAVNENPAPTGNLPSLKPNNVPEKHMENSQFQEINTQYMNQVHSDTLYKNNTNVLPPAQTSNVYTAQGAYQAPSASNFAQLDCFPKDQLVSSDLLPRDGGFAESNPQGQGQLSNRNFFESGYHAGLNTQSSTLKNANKQLRSDPIIPRKDVGPWAQSTYDADTNRRAFEIGSA